MADTAWRCSRRRRGRDRAVPDVRQQQGFNVIQTVAIFPRLAEDPRRRRHRRGRETPSSGDRVEFAIDAAAARGMYLAIHPVWATSRPGRSFDLRQRASATGEFLGERFGSGQRHLDPRRRPPADGEEQLWTELAGRVDGLGRRSRPTTSAGTRPRRPGLADAEMPDSHDPRRHCLRYDVRADLIEQTHSTEPAKLFLDAEPIYEDHLYLLEARAGLQHRPGRPPGRLPVGPRRRRRRAHLRPPRGGSSTRVGRPA
ncbi:DUF4038 domain-containing protein [Pseudonocardia sp. MCCB 268]|nr:DUF4038 domain-containing protein [Pseudonocardia cytotoxica]